MEITGIKSMGRSTHHVNIGKLGSMESPYYYKILVFPFPIKL